MSPAPSPARYPLGPLHSGPGVRALHSPVAAAACSELQLERVASAFRGFLEALGLDCTEPNLVETDRRVARTYRELLGGLRPGAEPGLTTFPNSERYAGIVSVTNIPLYSLCAHHFLPFFGVAHVGYVPGERLVGLSKLSRVVEFYSRRPQLQERLTEQVAALLDERLAPAGVIVSVEARHLCLEMRGISRPGVTTSTTAVRGTLRDERLQRQFFARLRGS
ncbi:MAG TPA: GTP cyclohydrolase I FolE [Gemmatimonadales bacterium]|jgi:GTP cyclohydrolase I|nr:GTP cyclohydrolase I FolE [Gemmatimonadales bacterium]